MLPERIPKIAEPVLQIRVRLPIIASLIAAGPPPQTCGVPSQSTAAVQPYTAVPYEAARGADPLFCRPASPAVRIWRRGLRSFGCSVRSAGKSRKIGEMEGGRKASGSFARLLRRREWSYARDRHRPGEGEGVWG